jgi:hypothetical protein
MIRVEVREVRPGTYEWSTTTIRETAPGRFEWTEVPAGPLSGVSFAPLLDACQELSRAGAPPTELVAMFRKGRSDWDLRCSVGWGAAHEVNDDRGLRFRSKKI